MVNNTKKESKKIGKLNSVRIYQRIAGNKPNNTPPKKKKKDNV